MVMVGIENIREATENSKVVIKVIGAGGGGGNAVNNMINAGVTSVEFVAANTDAQDLKTSLAPYKLQLGTRCTGGMGAGAKPEIGRESALEDADTIREYLNGAHMVFITAGLGGGTGTGAAPVIAQIAREIDCLTIGVVTKPFKFEGKIRQRNAEEGIKLLRKHVDTLVTIPNDNLLLLANKRTSIMDAFAMADDVLRMAIQGISDLIKVEGLLNLDFADVKTVMSNMGEAIMGTGVGIGDNRAIEAAEKAIHSPLLDDCSIEGATGIIMNVTGPSSMTLIEVNEAGAFIEKHADEEATIIFGAVIDESMPEDQLEVTVIATGFGMKESAESLPEKEPARPMGTYNVYQAQEREILRGNGTDFPGETPSLQTAPQATPLVMPVPSEAIELTDPVMEPVETKPQIPDSYNPQKTVQKKTDSVNLDIPTFIRKRTERGE